MAVEQREFCAWLGILIISTEAHLGQHQKLMEILS